MILSKLYWKSAETKKGKNMKKVHILNIGKLQDIYEVEDFLWSGINNGY